MENIIAHTVWVVTDGIGYSLKNHTGMVMHTAKFKSTCEMYARQYAKELDIWAVAVVVSPSKRQPYRALRKSR